MNVKPDLIAVISSRVEAATQPRTLSGRGQAFHPVAQLAARFAGYLDFARCKGGPGYSSIARRTSVTVAAIGFNSDICPRITSVSFKPCPVTVQTIRLASGIFWNEYAAASASQHLKRPAIDAALAGSTKIPSCCASHLCAAKMSSSLTTSTAPCDSTIAARACSQLAG